MDRLEIGRVRAGAAFLLMLLRMPIGVALAMVSFSGIRTLANFTAALGLVRAVPYQFVANWSFSAVPMFLLMGFIASNAGLTSGLFRLMRVMLYRVPGGIMMASVPAIEIVPMAKDGAYPASFMTGQAARAIDAAEAVLEPGADRNPDPGCPVRPPDRSGVDFARLPELVEMFPAPPPEDRHITGAGQRTGPDREGGRGFPQEIGDAPDPDVSAGAAAPGHRHRDDDDRHVVPGQRVPERERAVEGVAQERVGRDQKHGRGEAGGCDQHRREPRRPQAPVSCAVETAQGVHGVHPRGLPRRPVRIPVGAMRHSRRRRSSWPRSCPEARRPGR
jgi:hypothetical protein